MSCNLSAQCDENGNWIGDGACFVECCDNITCPDTNPRCSSVKFKYKCGGIIRYIQFSWLGPMENVPDCSGDFQCPEPLNPGLNRCYGNFNCYYSIEEITQAMQETAACNCSGSDSDSGSNFDSGTLIVYEEIDSPDFQSCSHGGADCCCLVTDYSSDSGSTTEACNSSCHDVTITLSTQYECGIATNGPDSFYLVIPDGCCCKANPNIAVEVTATIEGGEACLLSLKPEGAWTGSGSSLTGLFLPGSGLSPPGILYGVEESDGPIKDVCANVSFDGTLDTQDANQPLASRKCSCTFSPTSSCGAEKNQPGPYNGLYEKECSSGAALFIKKIFGNKIRIKLNKKELMHRLQQSAKFRIAKRQRRNIKFK